MLLLSVWRMRWGEKTAFPSTPNAEGKKPKQNKTKKTHHPLTASVTATTAMGPKKQLAAFNLGTYVNEVGN